MNQSTPDWLKQARDHWRFRGAARPEFALEPDEGQESVWDYPRPPAVVLDQRAIDVTGPAGLIASTSAAIRVLETSHPPSFYLPPASIEAEALVVVPGNSHCEWKGQAEYLSTAADEAPVGWRYPKPYPEFADYAGYVSFYPHAVECRVDGELARAQSSSFYGGWITNDVVGPFKGDPGTSHW